MSRYICLHGPPQLQAARLVFLLSAAISQPASRLPCMHGDRLPAGESRWRCQDTSHTAAGHDVLLEHSSVSASHCQ